MTRIRLIPLLALIPCFVACSGSNDESKVKGGASPVEGSQGGGTPSGPGQPTLNVGDPSSTGDGQGGANADGQCGPNLTGLVRDFRAKEEMGGHPDFEAFSGMGASEGIVEDLLGSDRKPVYKPPADMPFIDPKNGQQTTNKERYDQWYRNTDDVNQAIEFKVPLMPGANGISSYDNGNFFPIDGQGFGNYKKSGHNYHFTFELHTEFTYTGGEIFKFTGDDDLWVFVNGHLGIDLGGLHPEVSKSIDLDQVADAYELEVGKTYPLDLFHAERHTVASHFRVETSIVFTNCNPIIIPK